jgi:hypothetical protein
LRFLHVFGSHCSSIPHKSRAAEARGPLTPLPIVACAAVCFARVVSLLAYLSCPPHLPCPVPSAVPASPTHCPSALAARSCLPAACPANPPVRPACLPTCPTRLPARPTCSLFALPAPNLPAFTVPACLGLPPNPSALAALSRLLCLSRLLGLPTCVARSPAFAGVACPPNPPACPFVSLSS